MLGRVEERDCQLQAFFCCSIQMQPQKVTSAHLVLDPCLWVGDVGHFKNKLASLVPCAHRTPWMWSWGMKLLLLLVVTC